MAARTEAFGKEEAEVGAGDLVPACVAGVRGNVAATWCGGFRQIFVLAVAAGPLVVPDVENGAGLRRGLRFHGGGIHLWSSGSTFAANNFLGFFYFGDVVVRGG